MDVDERATTPDVQRDLSGQHDGVVVDRDEQGVGEQPAHRGVGAFHVDRTSSGRHPADARRTCGEQLDDLPGGSRRSREQRVEAVAVVEGAGDRVDGRHRLGHRRQFELGESEIGAQGGQPTGRQLCEQDAKRRTEMCRGRYQVARDRDQPHRVVGAPHERRLTQPLQSRREPVRRDVEEPGHRLDVDRVGRQGESLDHLEAADVEAVEGDLDRGPAGRASRQRGDVGGHRMKEVGPQREHPGEIVVGLLAQPADEVDLLLAHPVYVSRDGRGGLVACRAVTSGLRTSGCLLDGQAHREHEVASVDALIHAEAIEVFDVGRHGEWNRIPDA